MKKSSGSVASFVTGKKASKTPKPKPLTPNTQKKPKQVHQRTIKGF